MRRCSRGALGVKPGAAPPCRSLRSLWKAALEAPPAKRSRAAAAEGRAAVDGGGGDGGNSRCFRCGGEGHWGREFTGAKQWERAGAAGTEAEREAAYALVADARLRGFCQRNKLDCPTVAALSALPEERAMAVVLRGDPATMRNCRNPSAIVMGRMKQLHGMEKQQQKGALSSGTGSCAAASGDSDKPEKGEKSKGGKKVMKAGGAVSAAEDAAEVLRKLASGQLASSPFAGSVSIVRFGEAVKSDMGLWARLVDAAGGRKAWLPYLRRNGFSVCGERISAPNS